MGCFTSEGDVVVFGYLFKENASIKENIDIDLAIKFKNSFTSKGKVKRVAQYISLNNCFTWVLSYLLTRTKTLKVLQDIVYGIY